MQSLIILTSATPFLKTLLTTTATPSHISDFRNRPRSDSRANKPDVFPGFDFLEEPTTVRTRTLAEVYTKVIGGIVNHGRQTYERIVNNIQKYEINRRANLRQNSDQTLQYIPVERNDASTESVVDATMYVDEKLKPSSKEQNWSKKYFSSILTAVGLNKLRNASDPEYLSKNIGISATYINPLLNLWQTATTKLNFERDTTLQDHHQYNKSTDSENDANVSPLQFNESIKANLVSNPPSSLGFRYAFSKYLNLISKGYGNDDENKTISEQHSKLTTGVPWGDVNLNNNNTMGVVDVDFPIERIDERSDNDNIEDSNDDESNDNDNYDAGNFGIFILEIFGTIAGLTLGAFTQIQNLFTQNGK